MSPPDSYQPITDVVYRPVCFCVEDMILEASVVLATLMDSGSRDPSRPTESLAPTTLR